MCFVAVGMAEVSGNEITVKVGQHINKGDQLGIFHFGGSTHVLLFRPGVNVKFNLHGQEPSLGSHNIKVHDEIRIKSDHTKSEGTSMYLHFFHTFIYFSWTRKSPKYKKYIPV